jgi:hypothetical protein
MRYTKKLDSLLRERIALQRELDEQRSMWLGARRTAADIAKQLARVDAAIASHVEGDQ